MREQKKQCHHCGSCCKQGGPALHGGDLTLLHTGFLSMEHLVTVRQGELAVQPVSGQAEPVGQEFLKVQGRAGSWCCLFYDELGKTCRIYSHRPLACELLDCAAPEALLAIAGRKLLSRFELIDKNSPILVLVKQHEEECRCPDMQQLGNRIANLSERESLLAELHIIINRDIRFRNQAIKKYNLSTEMELFYFGRPLFQLLIPLGIQVRDEVSGELILEFRG